MIDTFLAARSGIGVHQRRKLMELRNQYELTDEAGQAAGRVEQVSQSAFTLIARVASDLDVVLPVTLEVRNTSDRTVMRLDKPWFRMRVSVSDGDGRPVGTVAKRIRLGKAVFDLHDPSGAPVGEVRAENWRARDFRVDGPAGVEVARVTKQWRGLATELFTDADSYAVTFTPQADATTRALALASALSVDLVLKQKDR